MSLEDRLNSLIAQLRLWDWKCRLGSAKNSQDPYREQRYQAAEEIASEGLRAMPYLKRLIDEETNPVVLKAAFSAYQIMGKGSFRALLRCINSEERPDHRAYAALILGSLGVERKRVEPLIAKLLTDEDPEVRFFARIGLASIKNSKD